MSVGSYETLYGVGLLDDLHNYFPALLYESGRFNSVQQVLQYIRMQTAQRFNLFSYGQEQYRTQGPSLPIRTIPQPPLTPTPPSSIPIVQTFMDASGQRNTVPTSPIPSYRVVNLWDENEMALANELLGLIGASMNTTPNLGGRVLRSAARLNPNVPAWNPASFLQPVVVRPSQRTIEENSEVLTGISGMNCAICQEAIDATAQCRRLRGCRHTYHKTCIDTWFLESVHCPTCRHDIRERQPAQTTANGSSSSSQ